VYSALEKKKKEEKKNPININSTININSPLCSLMLQLLTWFSPLISAWHGGKCEQTLKSSGLEREETQLPLSGHTWYARHSTRQPTGLCCKFTHICPNLLAWDRNGKTIL